MSRFPEPSYNLSRKQFIGKAVISFLPWVAIARGKTIQRKRPSTKLKRMLTQVIDHAREDIPKISEARTKALLEKTAYMLSGLRKEYEDYESDGEAAWKEVS